MGDSLRPAAGQLRRGLDLRIVVLDGRRHDHDLRVGNDTILGGAGDDTIIGDSGLLLVPFTDSIPTGTGSGIEAALEFLDFISDIVHVITDFSFVIREANAQAHDVLIADALAGNPDAVKPAIDEIVDPDNHDLFIGNDTIEGGAGNDLIIGDDGVIVTAVLADPTVVRNPDDEKAMRDRRDELNAAVGAVLAGLHSFQPVRRS
ncbi:MAG: hypothetical protein IIA05_11640 [Proteobacteria bacterium]|nr:hypothetical protein [Pseudomonadota bacterium]